MALLTRTDQRRIDSVIQDIYLRTGLTYPVNSLLELAAAEDITIVEADLSSIGANISGLIDYDDPVTKTGPKVYINANINKQRKQFTLAHELGHHFLHSGTKFRLDTLDYSRTDQDAKDESEANYFAASLLVPEEYLKERVRGGASIQELAAYFGVSVPVIQNRLRWLKLN